jgi:hypothetical protein
MAASTDSAVDALTEIECRADRLDWAIGIHRADRLNRLDRAIGIHRLHRLGGIQQRRCRQPDRRRRPGGTRAPLEVRQT